MYKNVKEVFIKFCLFIKIQLIFVFLCITAEEEPEKKELLGVNTGTVIKPVKLNPFVKIFSFFKRCIFSLVKLAKGLCMQLLSIYCIRIHVM